MTASTISEVIDILENIIQESKSTQNPLGYFAALYKKVTIKVKEGIANNFFDDGARMEKLDVIFANRYIEAYFAFQENKPTTLSWQKTFEKGGDYWPTVLQHLLLGMNAHINLDLGIAAAKTVKGADIKQLENDFNKINDILSSLVLEIEKELSIIWPTLRRILKFTHKVDDFLIDFSMELARDGAWTFANELHTVSRTEQAVLIAQKDEKVSNNVNLVVSDKWFVKLLFGVMRLGERGRIVDKIDVLTGLWTRDCE